MVQKFKTLADAVALAEYAHRNQIDKAGMPYIDHPRRVLETVQAQGVQPYVQIAAILHDVTEDTAFTSSILLDLGFSEAAVKLVRLLDRDYSQSKWDREQECRVSIKYSWKSIQEDQPEYFDQILREYDVTHFGGPDGVSDKNAFYYWDIKKSRDATIVKLADIRDNMSPWRQVYLPEETQVRLRAKYTKALKILNPAPVNHGMLTDYVHDPYHLR